MDYPGHWFRETWYDHDIYLMIIKEPGPPHLHSCTAQASFSYVGRLAGHGQHPSFSLHFACPPYGNDYACNEAALRAGRAHGRALIERWRNRPRTPPAGLPRYAASPAA
jgi:hypothetical protein